MNRISQKSTCVNRENALTKFFFMAIMTPFRQERSLGVPFRLRGLAPDPWNLM